MDNHNQIVKKEQAAELRSRIGYANSFQTFEELMIELKDKVQNADLLSIKVLLRNKSLPQSSQTHDILEVALINGHSDIFLELVKHGPIISDSTQTGQNTFLHYAAKLKDERPVEFLIKHNVDLTCTNDKNETPLHIAARNVNKNIVNILLKQFMESNHGFQNVVDSDGISVFHILCMGSNSSYVTSFLENSQISINDTVSSTSKVFPGYSPLHFAVAYSRNATVSILLNHGASQDAKTSDNLSMLHLICDFSDIQWMIYEAKALSDSEHQEILLQNLEMKCMDRLKLLDIMLLYNMCNVKARDTDGNNPLMYAVLSTRKCIYKVYKQLKSSGIDVSLLSIENCIVSCQMQTIERILECYVSLAFSYNEAVNTCKKKQQLINSRNNFGSTCLHHMAATKYSNDKAYPMNKDILHFLLENGADINACNSNFSTPLHLAAKNNSCDFVNTLLQFNLHILKQENARLPDKKTAKEALINPTLGNADPFARMININAQDNAGDTPLYYAYIAMGTMKENTCFDMLMHFGADLSIENERGKTVLGIVSQDILEKVTHDLFLLVVKAYKNICKENSVNAVRKFLKIKDLASEQGISIKFISNFWLHLKKLETCNLYTDRLNNNLMERISAAMHLSDEIVWARSEFSSHCKHEMDRIKQIKLNSVVSLHDVLCKNINKVVIYASNDILRQILKSPEFSNSFPVYEKLLKARYVRALARRELWDSAMISLKSIMQWNNAPNLCLELMISYLSEKKLRDIIEVDRVFRRKNLNNAMTDMCEPLQKVVKIS